MRVIAGGRDLLTLGGAVVVGGGGGGGGEDEEDEEEMTRDRRRRWRGVDVERIRAGFATAGRAAALRAPQGRAAGRDVDAASVGEREARIGLRGAEGGDSRF